MTEGEQRTRRSFPAQPRSVARLAAVQALYGCEMSGAPADAVLDDFLRHGLGRIAPLRQGSEDDAEVDVALAEPDTVLLAALVRGVLADPAAVDAMLEGALSAEWPAERLEAVLRAILRAGAFELAFMPETPARVVISEYVDVAHAFYAGPEPKLTNAVLDRIAQTVRREELDNRAPG